MNTCCYCGRDTTNDHICYRCRSRRYPNWATRYGTDEYKDRKVNSPALAAAMEFVDFAARNEEEGWPYPDYLEEE